MPETDVIKRKLFLVEWKPTVLLHCCLTKVSERLDDVLAIKDCSTVVKTRKWQCQLWNKKTTFSYSDMCEKIQRLQDYYKPFSRCLHQGTLEL